MRRDLTILLVLAGLGLALPWAASEFVVSLALSCLMYAALASSWSTFCGSTRYLSLATRTFGTEGSRAYVSVEGGLDADGVCQALAQAQSRGEPVAVLGASFSFVHLLDAMASRGLHFALPAGSR